MKAIIIGANRFKSKKGNDTLMLFYTVPLREKTSVETGKKICVGREAKTTFVNMEECETTMGYTPEELNLEDYIGVEVDMYFNASGYLEEVRL